MKLKTRLTIAFLIIILVPAILFSVAFFGFTRYQVNVIEDNYGVSISFESIADSMQLIGKSTQDVFEGMKKQAEVNPERFLDENLFAKEYTKGIPVKAAQNGNDAGILGAAALAMQDEL